MTNEHKDVNHECTTSSEEELREVTTAQSLDEDSMQVEDETSESSQGEQEEVSELDLVKAQLEEETNKHLRLRADFDNYRKRVNLDREAAEKYKNQQVLHELLPVLDNFERALQVDATSEDAKALKKGIEMVYQTLQEVTKNAGLEPIDAVGQHFDAHSHQPVMTEKDEEQESGIVLQELQKGYRLKDRVIRPSMVKVNE
ncbi:nucleotide exchange factor GrpE [Paenisporosarcina cavernae]|uniref:Protein GrpE n=1 Tax=Paenisporosarcina cavernae TaxID=2320858 RepID=A0A385YVB3_9BACL|nr:nucleotide exchange factor GrpE [Paenisporosarcina cavernae]AYC29628.1 nucleotide exchange factor GrpE [Paenisporosarcina cavernae]